tara:strand:+ start:271 stop:735 length:465 start_codon:yes stop_codon:yes gene_type:complete
MIVKIPENLANPYTKQFSQKKPESFKNQYLADDQTMGSGRSPINQKTSSKPTLTPLAQLRERAQQNKTPKPATFKAYNPVLSGGRDKSRTPAARYFQGKLEAHSDSDKESEYSGEPETYTPQVKKEKSEPYSFVSNFLSAKGIINEEVMKDTST